MAIILDRCNDIKTNYHDFIDELKHKHDGLRCVLDIDLFFYDYTPTRVDEFKLIPLDKFTCKRTIVGNHGTNIDIETTFGVTKDDFIDMEFQEVELQEKHKSKIKGLLISSNNPYFDIVNALAIHLNFVDVGNTNSFILDESELSDIKLIPFNLKYEDYKLIISDIEDEMNVDEYDGIVEQLYCSDCAF